MTTVQKTEVGFTVAGSATGSVMGEAADAAISKAIALMKSISADFEGHEDYESSRQTVCLLQVDSKQWLILQGTPALLHFAAKVCFAWQSKS